MTDKPKYTVSGNHMRIFRLDPEGNPLGEPIEVPGLVSFDIEGDKIIDGHFDPRLDTYTLDVEFDAVQPDVFRLLTGMDYPVRKPLTRWQRVKRWVCSLIWLPYLLLVIAFLGGVWVMNQ